MINITKPFLPPIAEYQSYLSGIWERNWLTNSGPLANELESKLEEFLGVKNLLFVSNGTVALELAIKILNLKGEIITTPFSFVATTSSIVWSGCTPVFVDIDKESLNIDATKIEKAITKKTSAILATHVYGNPCDVEKIEAIAKKHRLKVIYDGAHAFGVRIGEKSIFEYGDISICSTHATKLYHTGEGGFMVTKNKERVKQLDFARNFGFHGSETFENLGTNAKNSEFHAALGLVNLKYINNIHKQRKLLTESYNKLLLSNKLITAPKWHSKATLNYAYYPIIFESEKQLLTCMKQLQQKAVFSRRYFYPSLAKALPYLKPKNLAVTDLISKRVLCIPLYHDLSLGEVELICKIILNSLTK